MNNDNSRISLNKVNYNSLEKNLFPFFQALPQDVPVDWMIPFFYLIEDLQLIRFIFNDNILGKLRPFYGKIFSIFNPTIKSYFYFYVVFGLIIISTIYIYSILCYFINTRRSSKTLSKKKLWFLNSMYIILYKYLLSYVFLFLTQGILLCKQYKIPGLDKCDSMFSKIEIGVSIGCTILIIIYNIMYNNYSYNTDCLSHGKYFGSIHNVNTNVIMFTKLLLASMDNLISQYLLMKQINQKVILLLDNIIIMMTFSYISRVQLKRQPYYSTSINNYKFATYFTLSSFSIYTTLLALFNFNNFQFIADSSPFIILILFIGSYKYNNYYHKKMLHRIYKKYQEKKIVNDLKQSIDNNPENVEMKNIYNSVERITKEVYVKKEIKVFCNYYECEIASRFLRNNRNLDAYVLMKSIFEEGLSQYEHEADVYIITWYYMHSMKKFYKDNNLLKKYDMELFNGEQMLNIAMDLKLDTRKKFLIYKAQNYIEIEKREDLMKIDSNDVEASIKLEEMKRNAIITHVHGLQEIKELYNKLRNTTNPKDIASYGQHIVNISKYQESANWQYKNILRQFPESVDILKVYVLFLTDVMNKDDLANKTANRIPREIEEMENKRNSICSNNFKNKKAITLSSNSLASATYSEVPSCISGVSGLGKEIRKKISLKNSMTKKYILPIKQLKVKMTICIILFIIVFGIQALFTIFIFDSIKKNVEMLNTNMCIPGYIKSIAFFIRNLSLNFITGKMYNYYRNNGALIGISGFLAEQNLPIVTAHMDVPTVNPLYIPVGKYSFDTVETISLADAYKKLLSFVKFCLNRGFLSETENMEEILFEPHFRYFLINSIRNMDLVFIRCKEILRDKIINLFGNVTVIIIGLELTLAIITLYIGFITFFPLKKSTKKISFNALKMLKCLSKENYEQITKDYEEKIETLCENYELEKEDIELKNDKGSLFKNIILFFSFIIIIAYIVISGIPVLQTITEVKDIIAISQKSIDRLLAVRTIQMYTYEVINQDKSVFLQDEPQRILKSHLNQLELIQDELKTGSYGGPTFDAYPLLNDVLKEGGCFRYEGNNDCDNMTYDSSYGFSKEIGTLPINELIREYIYNVKNFISNYEKGKYVNVPFSSKENISIIFEEVSNDQFFKLQDSLVDNIVGDLQYINQVIMEHGESLLSQMSEEVTILIGIGVVLFLTIDFFVFNKMYTEKIKEMNALVSFLFLVPPSIINKNEKYKSFLETAQVIE